jgi:chemotaxis protein CheY-P-specific phosphatase CheC
MLAETLNGGLAMDREQITWLSDLMLKALCGAITILLGVAVSSLQSMNAEIKELNVSVNNLSTESRVVSSTIESLAHRVSKVEAEQEKIREKIIDIKTKK